MVIAIDGLSINGKTTLANRIAQKLDYKCFNTGAVYRCYALYIMNNNLDLNEIEKLIKRLKLINISFREKRIILNGDDVTDNIYTNEISIFSTEIATIPEIHKIVNQYQKKFIKNNDTVMEGRDIGTRIAPKAEYKFYLYANLEVRAKRLQKSKDISFEKALETINQLDEMDINDKLFIKPKDAIEIDTSNMSIDEVFNLIMSYIK